MVSDNVWKARYELRSEISDSEPSLGSGRPSLLAASHFCASKEPSRGSSERGMTALAPTTVNLKARVANESGSIQPKPPSIHMKDVELDCKQSSADQIYERQTDDGDKTICKGSERSPLNTEITLLRGGAPSDVPNTSMEHTSNTFTEDLQEPSLAHKYRITKQHIKARYLQSYPLQVKHIGRHKDDGWFSKSEMFGNIRKYGAVLTHQKVTTEEGPTHYRAFLDAAIYLKRCERRRGRFAGVRFAEKFISSRGNEYFCDIDEEYLTDRFNLTNLNTEVQYYQHALDLVTDVFDLDCDEDMREQIEKSARHLYGLVHARYIVTNRGLQKMVEKFKKGDFGKCPRVACEGQPLLPMGQHDVANTSPVKLYCARCEDLYNPKSNRHASIDGAYFGTSFHGILFQVYPQLIPPKTQKRHEPKIYGFRVHAAAALARWQEDQREKLKERLGANGIESGFEREDEEEMEDGESQGDDVANEGIDDMFEGRRIVH